MTKQTFTDALTEFLDARDNLAHWNQYQQQWPAHADRLIKAGEKLNAMVQQKVNHEGEWSPKEALEIALFAKQISPIDGTPKASHELIDTLALMLGIACSESKEERWNDELLKRRVLSAAINELNKAWETSTEKPAVQDVEPKPVMQYFYRASECSAKDVCIASCLCWHDEGTGPYPSETFLTRKRTVQWREKPAQAEDAAVRAEESVPVTYADIVDNLHQAASRMSIYGLDDKSLYRDAAFEIDKLRRALLVIREACGLENSPLTGAIAETCDSALGD